MWKDVRVYLGLIAAVLAAVAIMGGMRLVRNANLLRNSSRAFSESAEVIRRPTMGVASVHDHPEQNIAPYATVTVSSTEESSSHVDSGVADGQVDMKNWVTHEEREGAWIKLSWLRLASITAVTLYDRPGRADNVLGGTLIFEDGTQIAVPALPASGGPWRVNFPAKIVHWVIFRIDRAEGTNTGLEEFMVYGTLTP